MSSFQAYVANGKSLDHKAVVAYIRKFLDKEYRQSNVYSLITEHASMDEIEKILKDDLELRIPLSNRRIRLFHLERKEDEELSQFMLRVKEHARYAEVDKLPVEDIITLIISSRCNIKQLTDMWVLRRNLTLKEILIDCEAYQRKEKASKDFDKLGQKSKELDGETQVNKADIAGPSGMSGVKKQRGNNRGKKGGRGGNDSNRGGSNNTQVYDNTQPQNNQGYGQPRGGYNGGYYNQGNTAYNTNQRNVGYNPPNYNQQQYPIQQGYQNFRGNGGQRGYPSGGGNFRGRGGQGGPSGFNPPNSSGNNGGMFKNCYRCEGSLGSVHGVGHWKWDYTTPLKCLICNGPHYVGKCEQFKKEEHSHLLYNTGHNNTQRASLAEPNPMPHDNS